MTAETLSPEEFARDVERALPQCTSTQAALLVERAQLHAEVQYGGQVPEPLAQQLRNLEGQCLTLMMLDAG